MVAKEQFNSYGECAKSQKTVERGPKECDAKEKKKKAVQMEVGARGYKSKVSLPFFNEQQAHKCGPLGPRKSRSMPRQCLPLINLQFLRRP